MKLFSKNDNFFICEHCKKEVEPLKYTSRDHCNYCLYSMHVDNLPGDRSNDCHGLLKPIGIEKYRDTYKIIYECKNMIILDVRVSCLYRVHRLFDTVGFIFDISLYGCSGDLPCASYPERFDLLTFEQLVCSVLAYFQYLRKLSDSNDVCFISFCH